MPGRALLPLRPRANHCTLWYMMPALGWVFWRSANTSCRCVVKDPWRPPSFFGTFCLLVLGEQDPSGPIPSGKQSIEVGLAVPAGRYLATNLSKTYDGLQGSLVNSLEKGQAPVH